MQYIMYAARNKGQQSIDVTVSGGLTTSHNPCSSPFHTLDICKGIRKVRERDWFDWYIPVSAGGRDAAVDMRDASFVRGRLSKVVVSDARAESACGTYFWKWNCTTVAG